MESEGRITMNRLTRLLVTSAAGLTFAITASPALAAPPTDPDNNRARVTRTDGSGTLCCGGTYTEKSHLVQRQDDSRFLANYRQQATYDYPGTGSDLAVDSKQHTTGNENVYGSHSQYTDSYPGFTCRSTSNYVFANGETRTNQSRTQCN